ncbi:MAG: prepilin peptidase [Thermoguttaceae bacterium]
MPSPETAHWFLILWFVAMGAAVGSFLNVVVYRLPLGLSLSHPPSHCPNCKHGIPWYDNIPVFGWIKLRGRCRHCHDRISFRYPAVEAVTAVLFGVVAGVDYFSTADAPLLAICVHHVVLLCPLLCAALIEYDRQRPPLRLFTFALVLGLAMPLLWPGVRPVDVSWPWPASRALPPWLIGVLGGLVGLSVGALLGATVWGRWSTCPAGREPAACQTPRTGLAFGLLCVGAFLGWQATVLLAAATGLVALLLLAFQLVWPRLRVPGVAVLMALTLAWILFGEQLVSLWKAC